MSFSNKSGLDTLIDTPTGRVADFALKSGIVRAALRGAATDFVVLPERGSLPVYWGAQGHKGAEDSVPVDEVRLPIGTTISEDQREIGGLTKPVKSELIRRALAESGLDEIGSATLLDEVQHGGTISFAAHALTKGMADNALNIIAAQDTLHVNKANLSPRFKSIALNQKQGITSTVVPIPLIATDKNPLLNTLIKRSGSELQVDIHNNMFSEQLFRTLGSIARKADIADPSETLLSLLYVQKHQTTRPESEIEQWAEDVVAKIIAMRKM